MKRTPARRPVAAGFLLALAFAPGLGRAQTPPASPAPPPSSAAPAPPPSAQRPAPRPGTRLDDAPTFGERIEVRVVNVEVVVTDKSGTRVPGLGAADFRLKVDGKEVPIEYFSEVRGGDAVVPGPSEGPIVAGLPSLAPGSPVGTSYLVLVDDYFSLAQRRDEVLRSLKDDIGRLQPEDRMAIVAYDGRKLDMLASWTGDQAVLGRALGQAMTRPAHGLDRLAELRSFDTARQLQPLRPLQLIQRSPLDNRLDVEERSYAERLAAQVQKSVDAAISTLRSFASPPGRKVMLLLDGGWPYSPGSYVANDVNRPVLDRDVPDGEALLRPLADAANLLGYTVYPVDVPGLDGTTVDAAQGGPPPVVSFPVRQQEISATLDYVAQETGGRPLRAGLRRAALENAAGDTRAYYWLGFSPAHKGDDRRHNVQVEVRRAGLKVRSRSGYVDLSKGGESAMMVESAMLFGSPAGSESLPFELGAAVRSGRREIEVPLKVALPVNAMAVVPIEGKYRAELELRVAALDENGNRSDIPMQPIKLAFATAPERGKYVPYGLKLKLRRIRQHLVIALFDPIGGKILTAETDVNPPK
ncbi:MAG TPA: VWA domain-containing protein [Thermoanaerobaculia bacterium]|nr:VWA domain-containing protein [Thermoanaerobaculia bacterium]